MKKLLTILVLLNFFCFSQNKPVGEYFDVVTSGLSNLNDFSITSPNSTVSLGSGKITTERNDIAAGFSDYFTYNAYGDINSKYWIFDCEFNVKRQDATSYGFGFGFLASCANNNTDYIRLDINCSNANKGILTLRINGTYAGSVPVAMTLVNNDKIKLTITRNDRLFSGTCQNMTSVVSVCPVWEVKTILSRNTSAGWEPTQLKPYFYNVAGKYELLRFGICSKNMYNPDLIVIGNSIGHGMFINTESSPWPEQVAKDFNLKVYNFCSQSTNSADLLRGVNEVVAHAPREVWINGFRNDCSAGIIKDTILKHADTLYNRLTRAGIKVKFISTISSNGVSGITTLNSDLLAKYPNNFIDIYSYFDDGGGNLKTKLESGDHTHLNEWGQIEYERAIILENPNFFNK